MNGVAPSPRVAAAADDDDDDRTASIGVHVVSTRLNSGQLG